MSLLRSQHIAIGYHTKPEKIVLSNINLCLFQGELTCLLGQNGIGKTTLIKTLTGILPALSGKVLIDNKEIQKYNNIELSKLLSIVLTNVSIPSYISVFDMVSLGRFPYTNWLGRLTKDDKNKVLDAIEVCGISKHRKKFINELSDGERQKAFIARAIAQDTPIVILDEPTAHLDVISRLEVLNLLKNLAKEQNKAILLSTHDIDTALHVSDRIWLVKNMQIKTGIPEDLVLNQSFDDLFESPTIQFDISSGNFKNKKKPTDEICLTGMGNRLIWTKNALERTGFNTTSARSEISIEILDTENTWIIRTMNKEIRANSIEELLQYVNRYSGR